MEYHFFWSGPLSQWHPSNFIIGERDYYCAEQYMMHQKAILFGDHQSARKILSAINPAKQKAIGKQVCGFNESKWRSRREDIVYDGNLAKFSQNKGLRRKLFQTGNAILVEASPRDTIWGIGLSENAAKNKPPAEWPGMNLLGKVLAKVRESLRSEFPDETDSTQNFEDIWRHN